MTKRVSTKKRQRKAGKNVSIKTIVGKVGAIVRKPFGGKCGRRPKLSKDEAEKCQKEQRIREIED